MKRYCECGNEIENPEDDLCQECYEKMEGYEEDIKPLNFHDVLEEEDGTA